MADDASPAGGSPGAASGPRLGAAVIFVQHLDRSVRFYTDVLELEIVDASPTAALLASSEGGAELILRAMGSNAAHALGSVGVQYMVWIAPSRDYLDRCERQLKQHSAHRETRTDASYHAVEGHDPDDIVVMVVYPGPEAAYLGKLPARIYGW
jgi:catechol 2,3-dioxygenase-like lactoylglutathione lyase family enzyme